jgi:hypothetical protein
MKSKIGETLVRIGVAIPSKATVGELVLPGCTVGAAVVPQVTAATATAAVIHYIYRFGKNYYCSPNRYC